jgi:hypothetical protein
MPSFCLLKLSKSDILNDEPDKNNNDDDDIDNDDDDTSEE